MPLPPPIYALAPRWDYHTGHLVSYHVAIQQALESLGFSYTVLLLQHPSCRTAPDHWNLQFAVLEEPQKSATNFLFRIARQIKNILKRACNFGRIFRSLDPPYPPSPIFFLEDFNLMILCSLVLGALVSKKPLFFWLLFRYDHKKRRSIFLLRGLLFLLEKRVGSANVKYLTDSDLLSQCFQCSLKRKFVVMPIPHTATLPTQTFTTNTKDTLYFWWPGGSTRPSKGLQHIQNLSKLFQTNPKVRFVLAENAKPLFQDSSNILFIRSILSREEYLQWMHASSLILLPYDPHIYSHGTSGIFVESIFAGKIPVTTKGTWMAYELAKFDLTELTFDWTECNLIEQFTALIESSVVKPKIQRMSAHYHTFHTQKNFAQVCQSLIIPMNIIHS